MEKLLSVENLTISFNTYAGKVQAVRNVSFSLDEGEIIAVVGESGCGKSVTAKALMGLLQNTAQIGEESKIIYKAENILDFTEKEWKQYRGAECAIVFQDALTSLNPTMSIGNQLVEKIMVHEKKKKADAWTTGIEMLELVGISNAEQRMKQYPHQLSGGMRQRVMIALALSCEPSVLIADEPTTALDVTIQAEILDVLKELRDKCNTSIILITHDLGIVANIAERVVVMYAGNIAETGKTRDIFKQAKHPYTKALIKAIPKLDKKAEEKLECIEGMPPNLLKPPKGCPFANRCKFCMNICQMEIPPKFDFENGQSACCWLHHPMNN